MKISELSTRSSETIPTIKYYIREGLLPAGHSISRNQSNYEESHLQRLQLIKVLREDLGMSVDKIGSVLLSAEQGGEELLRRGLEAAQQAQHGDPDTCDNSSESSQAWSLLTEVSEQLDWQLFANDPASNDAAQSISKILRHMPDAHVEDSILEYAQAMKSIAEREISADFDVNADPIEAMRYAILGTYLFEPLILALRRMAHAQRTAKIAKKGAE